MQCPKLILCSPTLTYPDVLDRYVTGASSTWCQLNGPPANVALTAFKGDAVYSRCPQSLVILDRPKKTRYFPGREADRIDIATGQYPADKVVHRPNIRQESK
jgi:hypothetical protein